METKHVFLLGIAIPMAFSSLYAEEKNEMSTSGEALSDTVSLQEITVRANFLNKQVAPVNLITIQPADIRKFVTRSNYVEMMQGNPGVYATASTGSYGDASLNMRGFKQENIAILLNGIPIQGLTSGSMYWNNWMGLSDATYAVQVQKGIGGSLLADCAMGGMVNIITRRSGFEPRVNFGLSTTQWGTTKGTLNYSSGELKNGWSIDLSLSYVKGQSFVECSDVETFSYMLNVSKLLNDQNTLIFTALGSPEEHDQRNTELTAAEVDKYGRDYSKNWGIYNGKAYSIARNHYFKPYFTLQHLMDGERLKMKNSLYLALADGGGRSTYSGAGATSVINHQTSDGHIDFDAIVAENKADGVSKNIILDYLSGHKQMGAITSAEIVLSDAWTVSSGLQYQYYDTYSKMEVLDLLGGDYFSLYGSKYQLGDLIGSSYGRTTHHASGYVQGKFTNEKISANLGISAFNGNYMRHNDLTHEESAWAHGWGMSVKGGLLWHAGSHNMLYINGGFNSRLPYANTFLASSDLSITNDIINEKNLMGEIGWRPSWQGGGMELSAYIASWKDRTLSVSIQNRTNEAKENYLVTGLDALHMGVELSVNQQITSWLNAKAYAMMASWKWKGSGDAHVYDKYTNEDLGGYTIYCDGLHVGDAPQRQLGASLDAKLPGGFYVNLGWQMNGHQYADFEPKDRTDKNDRRDAYRIPTYHLLDANVGWEGSLGNDVRLTIFATGQNLTDTHYIQRATDGKSHDLSSLKGYWGQARTVSCGMRLSF